jgi:phosphoglycolate phosphatase-like HAD superfamily hydrolase
MGRKHTDCLIPMAIKVWKLDPIADLYKETAEKINLYSRTRGINRFAGLALTFEELEKSLLDKNISFNLPNYNILSDFVNSGLSLSLKSLEEFTKNIKDPFISKVFEWSIEGDKLYEVLSKNSQPFKYVKETIEKMNSLADCVVISSAPTEALKKEWSECGLVENVAFVAGQELGSKGQQLKALAFSKYEKDKALMIGDALGDLEAATQNEFSFFPIIPSQEESCWKELFDTIYNLFVKGQYTFEIQQKYVFMFLDKLK